MRQCHQKMMSIYGSEIMGRCNNMLGWTFCFLFVSSRGSKIDPGKLSCLFQHVQVRNLFRIVAFIFFTPFTAHIMHVTTLRKKSTHRGTIWLSVHQGEVGFCASKGIQLSRAQTPPSPGGISIFNDSLCKRKSFYTFILTLLFLGDENLYSM